LILTTACASTKGTAAGGADAATITPPKRLTGPNPMLELRQEVRLTIEVLIDAKGTPDMRTLRVTGQGSGPAQPAIEAWLASSRFEPAKQNGIPVAGLFKTELRSRIVTRRM
jgi:hypothetical protein